MGRTPPCHAKSALIGREYKFNVSVYAGVLIKDSEWDGRRMRLWRQHAKGMCYVSKTHMAAAMGLSGACTAMHQHVAEECADDAMPRRRERVGLLWGTISAQ